MDKPNMLRNPIRFVDLLVILPKDLIMRIDGTCCGEELENDLSDFGEDCKFGLKELYSLYVTHIEITTKRFEDEEYDEDDPDKNIALIIHVTDTPEFVQIVMPSDNGEKGDTQ